MSENTTTPCKVPGCIYFARIKGYCPGHFNQLDSLGHIDSDQPVGPSESTIAKDGRRILHDPAHPNANAQGRILEHRRQMAERLGRKLEINEGVFTKNGQLHDARKNNLVVRAPESQSEWVDWAYQVLFENAPHLLYEATLEEEQKILDEVNDELTLGMNRLRGRLLGLIESFGLGTTQESALKSALKTYTYDLQAALSENLNL